MLDHMEHIICAADAHAQMDVRVTLLENAKIAGQKGCGQWLNAAEQDQTLLTFQHTGHGMLAFLQALKRLLRVCREGSPGRRERHPLIGSSEQFNAQFGFQGSDLPAQRGLGNQTEFGSLAKILRLRSRQKVGQLTNFHALLFLNDGLFTAGVALVKQETGRMLFFMFFSS
jgi:hypothetical protein